MNVRKIKLALTIKLINSYHKEDSTLSMVKDLMKDFKEEVGSFVGTKLLKRANLDQKHERSIYAIYFENCTLSLDLVKNIFTKDQYVNGFQLQ